MGVPRLGVSGLCRQIINFQPASLLMPDNNEAGLNDLGIELSTQGNDTAHKVLVGGHPGDTPDGVSLGYP